MADGKLTLTQWGTQYLLGSLRDFIDEGIESPGIAQALTNRRAGLLKLVIESARVALPHKPKFSDLEGLSPLAGLALDLANVNENESFTDNTAQIEAVLRWLAESVTSNERGTVVMISRRMGVDP